MKQIWEEKRTIKQNIYMMDGWMDGWMDRDYIGGFRSKGIGQYCRSRFRKEMSNGGDEIGVGDISQMD